MNTKCYSPETQDLPQLPQSLSCIYKIFCASESEDKPTQSNDKTCHEAMRIRAFAKSANAIGQTIRTVSGAGLP